MHALAQIDDRLQIGKLSLEYSVCGNQQTAVSARQRLDRLLENSMRHQLVGLFEPLRAAGDGLWFIRRLELTADIDLELSDRDIMRNWSRQFARALQHSLLDNESDEVIYFEDYPQYLARFISDLAKGSAWHAWYYQSFSGLRALPANMAIVTALLQQPALGVQALSGLPRADRARVMNALTAQGAQRLLREFASMQTAPQTTDAELLRAIISELEQQPGIPLLVTDHPWLETLELYLRVVSGQPLCAGQKLSALALAVVTLGELVNSLSSQSFKQLSSALLGDEPSTVFRLIPVTKANRLQPIMALQLAAKRQLLAIVQPAINLRKLPDISAEPRYTPFGGVFLLLQMLQDLPLDQILAEWPQPETADKQAVVRLLLLAQCLGARLAGRVFRDPVVRELAAVPPGLTARAALAWLADIRPAQLLAAQQRYILWRLSASNSHQAMVKNCAFAHRRLAIAHEAGRGCWLLLRGYQPRHSQRLQQALEQLMPDGLDCQLQWEAQSASLKPDLDYLQLPAVLLPGNQTRWLLVSMAQGMLRDFAWRLPGFAHSSLSHLADNFLSIAARLEVAPQRWLAQLGRPPLNVVLSMTGMARKHYRLAWLNDQQIELYQGD